MLFLLFLNRQVFYLPSRDRYGAGSYKKSAADILVYTVYMCTILSREYILLGRLYEKLGALWLKTAVIGSKKETIHRTELYVGGIV
ncbi:hypothetical protein GCM10020331_063330 [Ectobacillus funiculus]